MKTEKEIETAIRHLQDFNNTEVFRCLFTDEGKQFMLDRIKVLKWVLE